MLLLRCLRKVVGVVTVFNSITLVLKYAREISEKSLEQKSVTKSSSKFSCEIDLEFQKQIVMW